MYRNAEGYASPTEGTALAHIIHGERVRARAERLKNAKFTRVWTNPNPMKPKRPRREKEAVKND